MCCLDRTEDSGAEDVSGFSSKCDILDEDILKQTDARIEEWANGSFEWL